MWEVLPGLDEESEWARDGDGAIPRLPGGLGKLDGPSQHDFRELLSSRAHGRQTGRGDQVTRPRSLPVRSNLAARLVAATGASTPGHRAEAVDVAHPPRRPCRHRRRRRGGTLLTDPASRSPQPCSRHPCGSRLPGPEAPPFRISAPTPIGVPIGSAEDPHAPPWTRPRRRDHHLANLVRVARRCCPS